MSKGFFKVPKAVNEPVKSYAKGTPEREAVLKAYKEMWNSHVEVPLYIGSEEIKTGNTKNLSAPHDHKHIVGKYHLAEKKHIERAISAALEARKKWAEVSWEHRASIFLKAAELIAGPNRAKFKPPPIIHQLKTINKAEMDSACE